MCLFHQLGDENTQRKSHIQRQQQQYTTTFNHQNNDELDNSEPFRWLDPLGRRQFNALYDNNRPFDNDGIRSMSSAEVLSRRGDISSMEYLAGSYHSTRGGYRMRRRGSYLDEKMVKFLLSWLNERNFKLPVQNLFKLSHNLLNFRSKRAFSRGSSSESESHRENPNTAASQYTGNEPFERGESMGDGQTGSALLRTQNSLAREEILKLLRVLSRSRLLNLLLLVCHSILLVRLSYRLGERHLRFDQTPSKHFPLFRLTNLKWLVATKVKESTSSGQDVDYSLVLIMSLLDFMNNLHWIHWRHAVKTQLRNPQSPDYKFEGDRKLARSFLRSFLGLISSPRHIFNSTTTIFLMSVGVRVNPFPMILSTCNQLLLLAYNWFRVGNYIAIVSDRLETSTTPLQPSSSHGSSREQSVIETSSDLPSLDGGNSAIIQDSPTINSSLGTCLSNRPDSYFKRCVDKFHSSVLSRLDRYLLISQMFSLKVTISTILLHVDFDSDNNNTSQVNNFVIFAFLIEAFLTLHSHYDKYYSRYLTRRLRNRS